MNSADLTEPLRQSIMNKLNDLQNEIDRKRTRLASAMSALSEMCEGVAAGAKTLEPAVKLLERVVGAFSGLQRRKLSQQPAELPAPDTLGLPDFSEINQLGDKSDNP